MLRGRRQGMHLEEKRDSDIGTIFDRGPHIHIDRYSTGLDGMIESLDLTDEEVQDDCIKETI
jgi:hypothetical protein